MNSTEVNNLDFSGFSKMMYPFLGGGQKPSDFVCALIDNVMEEPQDEVDSRKAVNGDYNPLVSLGASGLGKIYNGSRAIAKNSATAIVAHLDKEKFESYISKLSIDALGELCVTLKENGIQAHSQNVATVCSDLFVNILTEGAKGKKAGEAKPLSQVESMDITAALDAEKRKLHLLVEAGGRCPNDNCAEPLLITKNGTSQCRFEITQIRPDEASDRDENLIALCPKCHAKYVFSPSAEERNRLATIKAALVRAAMARESTAEVKVEAGIADVIRKIAASQPQELTPLSYDPVAVSEKINNDNGVLLRKTQFHVNTYFNYVKGVFQQMSKQGLLRFEALSAQIRLCYLSECGKGLSQQEVYDALVDWLRTMTNDSRDACEIIIAYFIQNCEVFDAITK